MSETKLKILCIEDDEDTCDLITFVFKDEGYEVEACNQTDCLDLIHKEKFAAIILDNYFHGVSGVEICREIRSFDRKTPVVFLSGEARDTEIAKAMAAGANAYVTKPADFGDLAKLTLKLIGD